MRIVTAASANHGYSLTQLLKSLARWERWSPVAVYDLGLTNEHREAVRALGLDVTRFPFENYPAYFDVTVNAGEYAWKPVLFKAEFDKSDEPLVWLDAGDMVRFPLLMVRYYLRKIGFYSHRSSGTVAKWTHPGMYEALGLPSECYGDRKPLNTACVGLSPRFPVACQIVQAWYDGALDKSVIAPEGSNRTNHRQDQALMTLLAYKWNIVDRPCHVDRGLVTHRDTAEDQKLPQF